MTAAARIRVVALAAATLALAAACTSSGTAKSDDVPAVTSAAPTAPATTLTPAPSDTAAQATGVPTTPTATPSTSAAVTRSTSQAPPPVTRPQSTCTSLTVRVIRGGASQGQEFAALQFTNDGSKACVLVGYPSITLLLHGHPIGKPAQPSTPGTSRRSLAAGEVAESKLHDFSNCQAPLSDSVRVGVPGSRITVVRPAQLRACVLRVDRLGPPE